MKGSLYQMNLKKVLEILTTLVMLVMAVR